jgi:hypothetical protein
MQLWLTGLWLGHESPLNNSILVHPPLTPLHTSHTHPPTSLLSQPPLPLVVMNPWANQYLSTITVPVATDSRLEKFPFLAHDPVVRMLVEFLQVGQRPLRARPTPHRVSILVAGDGGRGVGGDVVTDMAMPDRTTLPGHTHVVIQECLV